MSDEHHIENPKSEGRFTRARPDCSQPWLWSSDDSDSTEYEVSALVGAFVRALKPEYVLETGSAWGQTAECIGKALDANGHGTLITLEPDSERATYTRARCKDLPVHVYEQTSLSYDLTHNIDFAWFDSLLHLRADEFRRFRPKMSRRCVAGFHDTGPQHPTRSYLKELEDEGILINTMYLTTPRGVCFGQPKGVY